MVPPHTRGWNRFGAFYTPYPIAIQISHVCIGRMVALHGRGVVVAVQGGYGKVGMRRVDGGDLIG